MIDFAARLLKETSVLPGIGVFPIIYEDIHAHRGDEYQQEKRKDGGKGGNCIKYKDRVKDKERPSPSEVTP
jgi:hypothetical protein